MIIIEGQSQATGNLVEISSFLAYFGDDSL